MRLLRLLAPPPASVVSLSPNTVAQNASNVAITVSGSSSNGSGFFDPGAGFARRLAASLSGSGITVTGVNFISPTSLGLTVSAAGAALGARTLTVTNPDGQTAQLVSALTVVAGTNTAPTANADAATTAFGVTLSRSAASGVLANDTDPQSDPLTAQLVTDVANGTLTLNTNGSFTYVPANGFAGADSFTYRAFDGALQSNVATVSIIVSANQAPTITAPATQTVFDPGTGVSVGPLAFTVGDPEGASLTVTRASSNTAVVPLAGVVLSGSGASRTVTVSTAGATTGGSSTITLTASDGFAATNAPFTMNVTRSTPPVAATESYETSFDTQLVVSAPGVLQNDTDVDAQTLTAVLASTTSHGALTLASNGGFTYLPAVGYIGPDSFSYRASDGVLTSNVVIVSITVTSNHAPSLTPPANASVVDFGSGATAGPLAFTVADFEGTPLVVTASSSNQAIVANGGLVLGGSGGGRTIAVSSVPGTVGGTATITLFVSDGQVVTTGTFTVTVTPQRGRPQSVAVVVTRNVAAFTWQAPPFSVEPVVGYLLDAGFSPGTTAVTLAIGNTSAFSVSAPDGVYHVRLRAQTTGGFSAPSNELVVGTGQAVPPLAPLRLLASVQGNAVRLQWTENPIRPGDHRLPAAGRPLGGRDEHRRGAVCGHGAQLRGDRAYRHLLRADGRDQRLWCRPSLERSGARGVFRRLHHPGDAPRCRCDRGARGHRRVVEPTGRRRDPHQLPRPRGHGSRPVGSRRLRARRHVHLHRRCGPGRPVLHPDPGREWLRILRAVERGLGGGAVIGCLSLGLAPSLDRGPVGSPMLVAGPGTFAGSHSGDRPWLGLAPPLDHPVTGLAGWHSADRVPSESDACRWAWHLRWIAVPSEVRCLSLGLAPPLDRTSVTGPTSVTDPT